MTHILGLCFLLCRWYLCYQLTWILILRIYWHFRREFMPVVFKHLVVSRVSFRTIMLPCTILCTLVSEKLDKVFQVSLACIVAGCQHYRKHLGQLWSVACKKIFRMLKVVAIRLRVYWNADVNCIRHVFWQLYTNRFDDEFAVYKSANITTKYWLIWGKSLLLFFITRPISTV